MSKFTTGSPLTSLNAIKMSASEVAQSFVPPPAFDRLLHTDNILLTGPRGSGKTTLLKMLQSEALENWVGDGADEARATVRAVGVFVGADRTWNEQLAGWGDQVDPALQRVIASAAFTCHVLRSLVDAMDHRMHGPADGVTHLRVQADQLDESALANRLSTVMQLSRTATSLTTLRALLTDRLAAIGILRNQLRRVGTAAVPTWAELDVLVAVDSSVMEFNLACQQPDQKWAMLFDELELAPEWIVEELLGALRGHQPRLLFKLSLAPAHARFRMLEQEAAPVPGQDYEHVPLTYARKLPAVRFAKAMVTASFERGRSDPPPSPERLLGSGRLDSREDFEEAPAQPSSAYAKGSPLWRAMKDLAQKDASFQQYLRDNELDLDALDELPADVRASRVRKIRNLVVVREYFRGDDGKRRSRKSLALYTGADNILSLPDGNPRLIVYLIRHLFPRIESAGASARVSASAQGDAIAATLQRFQALLHAQQAERIDGRPVGLMDLIDAVGTSLARRVVEAPFNDNVALTLRIPKQTRPEINSLLMRAINTGAFVHIPPKNSDGRLPADLAGKQFRLSHLLSCMYGLPIHLTPATSLDEHLPAAWRYERPVRSPALRGSAGQAALFEPRSEET